MFIDDYGNEFKTENEAREYAKKRFLTIFTEEPSFYLEDNVSKMELIDWIFTHEETKTLFLKDYASIIEKLQNISIENFIGNLWNLEEI